jgi:short-chain fatty acids transporter
MTTASASAPSAGEASREGVLVRIAVGFTAWAERWFPDAFIFVGIAVVVVSLAAMANGASPAAVSRAFGDGFWSLIAFTMQMAFVEAPYVMQAANDLKVHLGWAVQVYNAAEALPNLINPFWMLPLLGVLSLRARDDGGSTAR